MTEIYQDITVSADRADADFELLHSFLNRYLNRAEREFLFALHQHPKGLRLTWSEKIPQRWSSAGFAILDNRDKVALENRLERQAEPKRF